MGVWKLVTRIFDWRWCAMAVWLTKTGVENIELHDPPAVVSLRHAADPSAEEDRESREKGGGGWSE
jgi:hypothetical protein